MLSSLCTYTNGACSPALCCTLLLLQLTLAVSRDTMDIAFLALVAEAIHTSLKAVEFPRGLDHFACDATLCWHLDVNQTLLAARFVSACALFAAVLQPINVCCIAAEAFHCEGLPAAPALLMLRLVTLPAIVSTLLLCAAC